MDLKPGRRLRVRIELFGTERLVNKAIERVNRKGVIRAQVDPN